MNNKRGISLIILVVTIIVMIILAGIVIVSMQENNPIQNAKKSKVLYSVQSVRGAISEYANAQKKSNLEGITDITDILDTGIGKAVVEPVEYYGWYKVDKEKAKGKIGVNLTLIEEGEFYANPKTGETIFVSVKEFVDTLIKDTVPELLPSDTNIILGDLIPGGGPNTGGGSDGGPNPGGGSDGGTNPDGGSGGSGGTGTCSDDVYTFVNGFEEVRKAILKYAKDNADTDPDLKRIVVADEYISTIGDGNLTLRYKGWKKLNKTEEVARLLNINLNLIKDGEVFVKDKKDIPTFDSGIQPAVVKEGYIELSKPFVSPATLENNPNAKAKLYPNGKIEFPLEESEGNKRLNISVNQTTGNITITLLETNSMLKYIVYPNGNILDPSTNTIIYAEGNNNIGDSMFALYRWDRWVEDNNGIKKPISINPWDNDIKGTEGIIPSSIVVSTNKKPLLKYPIKDPTFPPCVKNNK